jgi:hypothetical protein
MLQQRRVKSTVQRLPILSIITEKKQAANLCGALRRMGTWEASEAVAPACNSQSSELWHP